MKHAKSVCVLGDGAWGTAVATLLAHNGYHVTIWSHDPAAADAINTRHVNDRYLADIPLHSAIVATGDMRIALEHARWIFCAVPVTYLRTVLVQARAYCTQEQIWVVLSKGIEQKTLLLPSQIIEDVLGYQARIAILSGPSYARDLATKQPTAVTAASLELNLIQKLQSMLANEYFKIYSSSDIYGVQAGGAFKNVIALAMGMLQGAEYADNTKAFVLTRGLDEIAKLANFFGGTAQTVYGLSGIGDLVLTSLGKLSRNTAVGMRLAQGESLESIAQDLQGVLPEGINTLQSIDALQRTHNLKLPICQGLYQVVFQGRTLQALLTDLMHGPLEQE